MPVSPIAVAATRGAGSHPSVGGGGSWPDPAGLSLATPHSGRSHFNVQDDTQGVLLSQRDKQSSVHCLD